MKELLSEITLDDSVVSYRHIRDRMRELILSGQIPAGSKLPSTQELGAHWKVDGGTVHAALAPLVKEGLLSRTPRKGTFVRKREEKLTCVGLYETAEDLNAEGGSAFQRAMLAELRRLMLEENIEPDMWRDPRPAAQKGQPWEALVRAADQRRVQAVILPTTGWEQYRWISKLPIPSAFFCTARWPTSVHCDGRRMAELCVNALADQGCRTLGVISGCPRQVEDEPGFVHEYVEYHQRLREAAVERGLRVDEAWVRDPSPEVSSGQLGHERFGYEQFQALWNLPERPEGLLVDVDTLGQGVVKALLERQVRVPTELKLVLGKNAHVDLFCPLPATYCVTDETALARALIEQVQKQFRGERCETIYVAPTLSQGNQETQKGSR